MMLFHRALSVNVVVSDMITPSGSTGSSRLSADRGVHIAGCEGPARGITGVLKNGKKAPP